MTAKHIKFHLPFGKVSAIGPGKADLLEAIANSGSISAGARSLGMSYKRAWDLVNTMNRSFKEPLVATATGGNHGGGAEVTEFGREVLRRYRAIEIKADSAVSADIRGLIDMLASSAQ
ncbi:MAG TPA: winged helix-turn-helix domain-containing protein [Methylophilaceae bacterium]|nr:winged helix-turn-helix domain-containing protein [Methylophilaceae bacterium]